MNRISLSAPSPLTTIPAAAAVAVIVITAATAAGGPDLFLHGFQAYGPTVSATRRAVFVLHLALSFTAAAFLAAAAALHRRGRPFLSCYGYASCCLLASAMLAGMLWAGAGLVGVVEDCWGDCGLPH